MGSKGKYLIIIFLVLPLNARSQNKPDFVYTDSITFKYYSTGDWKKVIDYANQGIESGIDYKFLRQRLGYAYFSSGDFYDARLNFEKALTYDSYNDFTLEYLYYSYLNTGKEDCAGIYAKRLNPEVRKKMSLSPFKMISALEAEYNYKYSGTVLRSDPQYYRFGISTRLGLRLNLYQSISRYRQELSLRKSVRPANISLKQADYYASLGWNASGNLMLHGAWHYLNTGSGDVNYNGNLFLLSVAPDFNRLIIKAQGTFLMMNKRKIYQSSVQGSYVFPGRPGFYMREQVAILSESGNYRLIFESGAGLKLYRNLWLEANGTSGNLDGYNDFNGLYVYNTYDPIIFRGGGTLTWYIGSHLSAWFNSTYEKRQFYEDSSFHYNQISYLAGLRWKI
jgi:tetratricopeptide (TPR) repeat protein